MFLPTDRWTFSLSRGAHAGDTVAAWSRRLVQLMTTVRQRQKWYATNASGEPLADDPLTHMTRLLAATRGGEGSVVGDSAWPRDKHIYEGLFATNKPSGGLDVGLQCRLVIDVPPLHGHRGDIEWPQSELSIITLADLSRSSEVAALIKSCAAACSAVDPHWGYLHGDEHELRWNVEFTGGGQYGMPQVGWLTYLRNGQFKKKPVALTRARSHQLPGRAGSPGGQLIEVTQRPWTLTVPSSAEAYLATRTDLLRAGAIRVPRDAEQQLAKIWQQYGFDHRQLTPDNNQAEDITPPAPTQHRHPPSEDLAEEDD